MVRSGKKMSHRESVRVVSFVIAMLAAVVVGWIGCLWWNNASVAVPKDTEKTVDEATEPRNGFQYFGHGTLMPCHVELAEFRLQVFVEKDGEEIMRGTETFCINPSESFERKRSIVRTRSLGPKGEFGTQQIVVRSFKDALEFLSIFDIRLDGTEWVAEHRFFAHVGDQGSSTLANGLKIRWDLHPIDGETATREFEENKQ